jgi:hypothetical protein
VSTSGRLFRNGNPAMLLDCSWDHLGRFRVRFLELSYVESIKDQEVSSVVFGATLEQLKDGSQPVSATGAMTWIELRAIRR